MRKRIACINEAPIEGSERRIAVPQPVRNAWLDEQVCCWQGKAARRQG